MTLTLTFDLQKSNQIIQWDICANFEDIPQRYSGFHIYNNGNRRSKYICKNNTSCCGCLQCGDVKIILKSHDFAHFVTATEWKPVRSLSN